MKTADAIRCLERANPCPQGMAPPSVQVVLRRLDELDPVAPPATTARPRRRRPSLPALGPALAALVAVAVVVAGLALLGHRTPRPAAAPAAPVGSGSPVSQFAILRRPQTAADRDLPSWLSRALTEPGVGPVIPSLTRTAGTLPRPGQRPIGLVVTAKRPAGARWPRLMLLMVIGNPRGGGSFGGIEFNAGQLFPGWGSGWSTALVPDVVRSVVWVLRARGPRGARDVTVHPTIHDNIASAPMRAGQSAVVSVSWYGAGGARIAYEDAAMQRRIDVRADRRARPCRSVAPPRSRCRTSTVASGVSP